VRYEPRPRLHISILILCGDLSDCQDFCLLCKKLFPSILFVAFHYRAIIMQKEVIEKVAALITAAFGLVAALAWNEAIQEIFRLVFGDQSGVLAMIAYAVIVTIIAVVVTIWIGRVAEKSRGRKPEGT
jgi:Flp pilus assembly pilin Flp